MSVEQRKSFRLPVPNYRQKGELRFGGMRMQIRLLDQSANGFSVIALQPPGVEIGGTGLLRAGDDWFEIRLINITPMDSPATGETTTVDQTKYFRLGLYRLADIADPDKKPPGWSWSELRGQFDNVMPADSTTIGFGVLFVIGVVLLPVAAILLLQNYNGKSIGDLVQFAKNIGKANQNSKLNWKKPSTAAGSGSTPINKALASDIHPKENTAFLENLTDNTRDLKNIISSHPGASVFIVPEVIHKVGITEVQQQQLQLIVDATTDAIYDLVYRLNGAGNTEQHQKLLNMAKDDALQLLTDEQRSKWEKISGENSPDKSPADKKDDK